MTIEQRLDLERQYHDQESNQARYAGRLKCTGCSICGSVDGMNSTHRETLAQLDAEIITMLAPWYLAPEDGEYLFHACRRCNRQGIVPAGYVRMRVADIPAWLDRDTDPMALDYEALAREPVTATAGQDSRDAAGLER